MTLWTYRATVLRVVDGDTLDVMVDFGFDRYGKMTLRLEGVDAPEVRMTAGVTAGEKAAGLDLAERLRLMIEGRRVLIQTTKDRREKYGRYLATVFLDGEDVNAWVRAESARLMAGQEGAK